MTLKANRPSQELVDLVGALRGIWHGNYAMCLCPAHADAKPSLSLRQGDRGIIVHCFAGCQSEDVLRELRRVKPAVGTPMPEYRQPTGSGNVSKIWDQGQPIAGTLAEQYLSIRRLPADLEDLRFHPRCPHKPKPHTEFKPALLVAVRDRLQLTAVQRIFLDPATAYRTEKVMLGRPGQGAWRPSLNGGRKLAIAEGMEDAAAFTAMHGIVCWASLGAERLHLLALPENIEELVIAEDNNGAGRAGARRAWATYQHKKLQLIRKTPHPFEDWAEANLKR
ncbi:toprim domain-containing protein [Novosphingobium sp. JCM 18896]|uniref:DUF7146 domain-containing protein n=1 Tax=Novosphingobium sp. JCM 18896 TaxID=2989731 RepID=UPI002221B9C3|nr:toprim domain-containing protein [Novosphingobium sp. JCM 18896]MCW1431976.1 toprim domain-containing protein [Novosphingobium sp. JCM 18896]